MAVTTLVLLRHAHTNANEHGTTPMMAGWAEIPISSFGERQLEILPIRFPMEGAAPVVYSSTSTRAQRTAEAVARGRRVVSLRALREISCGIVDGLEVSEVQRRCPELWQANAAQNDPRFAWPEGETYDRFRRRVVRASAAIAARHPGERAVVVTHAGVISQIVGYVRGESPARWEEARPGNCSVSVIEWGDSGPRVVTFDDRSHLGGLRAAAPRQRGG